ncbi:hypothetical protein OZX56_01730 [Lactobacillus sp. ESL0684]|nr:hypothetical protein [Lactobacillus sp. ESL0684]WEV43975.1 hypothetical protein OZX56_01730 [Lactobacillus sp. ESL0684]
MKKKWLILAILPALVLTFTSIGSLEDVQAVPAQSSHYWWKPRKMITTKKQSLWKINGSEPRYEQRLVQKKNLKKGSIVTVEAPANWPWAFIGNIPGIGQATEGRYFWVNNNDSNKWLAKYNQKNLKKYHKKTTHKKVAKSH